MADDGSVSGQHLANRSPDCFHIAYTHPVGGVDVPFESCDLWPDFWLSILRPLLIFNNSADEFSLQDIGRYH